MCRTMFAQTFVGAHRVSPLQRQTNFDVEKIVYIKTDDQWSPLPSLQVNYYEIIAVLIKIHNVSMLEKLKPPALYKFGWFLFNISSSNKIIK